jgi:putative transposase
MSLPRSSYYHTPAKSDADEALAGRIEQIAEEYEKYGYRRMTAQLHREGIGVNHKKVSRIMRERGLKAKQTRRYVKTTDSNHPYPVFPNLIKGLQVTAINQVWVADITYIRILTAFVYLAVILDLCSRKAIGYAISRNIDTALSLEALRMAIQARNPPDRVIHHSDQGVQYAAHDYIDVLREHKFQISMSRKGNPYDNAAAESFMKTLKSEEVYLGNIVSSKTFSGEFPISSIRCIIKNGCTHPWAIDPQMSLKPSYRGVSGYGLPRENRSWGICENRFQTCLATLT